jgi:glycogen phosphorylase
MKHPKCAHSFEVVAELPEALQPLRKLAFNFRWTWHHPTRELFREIDKNLFEEVESNPIQMLAQLSDERLHRLSQDPTFKARLELCSRELDEYLAEPAWFQSHFPDVDMQVAYFCAEFGISESLPIYSGGLGVLAGDHLKAASDLGLPLVGVGLLYARGYFRQYLTPDGWQQEHYPVYDFHAMPLTLERGPDNQPILVSVEFPDRTVTCQIWRADVGRVKLYLLDSNVLENQAGDQGITDTLYGGDEEMRLRQEMILGIGGMRALQALGISPTVCHMNEGHAAFLSVERIRQYMEKTGTDFRIARQVNVNGNVFTTHTPVPAGFDLFRPELLTHYLQRLPERLRIPFEEFLKMGRINPADTAEAFNMAVLAMENANHVNGVSKLHAEVSRGMFQARWPEYTQMEVPIAPVTNGIHTGTWTSARMTELFDHYLGDEWRTDASNPEVWSRIWKVPDAELWAIRENQRGDFVRFVRRYLLKTGAKRGFSRGIFGQVESILDPRILTIGFARRFATYKRASLMLTDRDRLKQLLFHPERPIQIVIAGKSHPRDDGGKKLIQDLYNFIQHEGARARMVFLEDYDMRVARMLVQGVDIWLNNPRRPLEASGTSGMKVVPNGGLNCSILDGWWDEGYSPGVGWAIGDRMEMPDQGQQDWMDSRTLYHLLENEIAPTFYHRVDGAVPVGWVEMMKRSIADLAPYFSTARMVQDYATTAYVPAHHAFKALEADPNKAGEALIWRDRISNAWSKLRILEVKDDAKFENPVHQGVQITATVDLDGLAPQEIRVQAAVGKVGPNRDLIDIHFHDLEHVTGEGSRHVYSASVPNTEPGNRGYTVRVVPFHPMVNVPHELPKVLWES